MSGVRALVGSFSLVLALAAAALPAVAEVPGNRESLPFPIWPLPQEATYEDERLLLRDAVIVVPSGDARAQIPGRMLAEIVADHFGVVLPVVDGEPPADRTPIVVGTVSHAAVAAALAAADPPLTPPEAAEGYALVVGDHGAVVAGRDHRGALYGVSSLVQLVHPWGRRTVAARQARLRDWPLLPIRWVHVFLPGREQLAFAERYFRDFLLRYKFNGLVLEVGGGMRLDSHPEISTGWRRTVSEWYAHGETMPVLGEGIPLGTTNRFAASLHVGVGGGAYVEKGDLGRLAAAAARCGLEVVPEIQSLSHAYYIASARRDVAEDPDMAWPDSHCPSNPESYRILFDVMGEYIDVLQPKRVHIGHDEWRAGAFCRRCRGRDTGELFADDVLKIHAYLDRDAFNHAPRGEGWDLSGLEPGRGYRYGVPYSIGDAGQGPSSVVVARRPGSEPTRVTLPVSGRWASLLFVQSATGRGREPIHAGDQTHFPRESSELLGFYEIRFVDGIVTAHGIRFDETVGAWDTSLDRTYYLTRPVVSGRLPDGRPAVLWASEWTNPRADVPIASVTLVGAPGPSDARPILFGVTGVAKPRVEDYR